MKLTNRGWLLIWFAFTALNLYLFLFRPVVEVVQYIPCAP